MAVVDHSQEINWQAKYLEQIDARLAGLERGLQELRAELRGEAKDLRGEMRDLRNETRRLIFVMLGLLSTVLLGIAGLVVKVWR